MSRFHDRFHRVRAVAFLGVFLASAGSVLAYTRLPELATPEKMAFVTHVGVGKITAIDDKPVSVQLHPQHAWQALIQVVDVEVSENIFGLQQRKTIRLGFWNSPLTKTFNQKPTLAVGQEGLFFAVKHSKEDFCVVVLPGGFLEKTSADFAKEAAEARHCGRLLARRLDGLTSAKASDRFLTAFMLLARYNDPAAFIYNHPQTRRIDQPIDAEESKLILLALADADWAAEDAKTRWRPQQAYSRLKGQGGTPPKISPFGPAAELDAAKKWLRDNAESYRITKFAPAAKE